MGLFGALGESQDDSVSSRRQCSALLGPGVLHPNMKLPPIVNIPNIVQYHNENFQYEGFVG